MAFAFCKELTELKLPESLTSIEEMAFFSCSGLTEIKFPKNLTSIGDSAFANCERLTEFKLLESLTSIGKLAFWGCEGLTVIKFPKSLTSIGDNIFDECTELTEVIVDENNPVFCSVEGVLFDKAMTTLLWFPEGKKGKYSVPNGVLRLRQDSFKNCRELISISFPQSLYSIGGNGFNCEQLTDITVNELNPYYHSIDGVLFDKESKALLEYPKNKDKTEYTVPEGILRISGFAFYGCKHLVNISLPESVMIIDELAFAECRKLKTIVLPMNLQYIGERVFDLTNLKTIFLSRKTRIGYRAMEGFIGQLVYRD
jgi:hypothetical protein